MTPSQIRKIIDHVANHFELSYEQVTGKSRKEIYVLARHLCYYILNSYCDIHLKTIGSANFFNADHTSVMHGRDKIIYTEELGEKAEELIYDLQKAKLIPLHRVIKNKTLQGAIERISGMEIEIQEMKREIKKLKSKVFLVTEENKELQGYKTKYMLQSFIVNQIKASA